MITYILLICSVFINIFVFLLIKKEKHKYNLLEKRYKEEIDFYDSCLTSNDKMIKIFENIDSIRQNNSTQEKEKLLYELSQQKDLVTEFMALSIELSEKLQNIKEQQKTINLN